MDSILEDIYHSSLAPEINAQDISDDWKLFYRELMAQAPELEKQFEVLRSDINQAYFTNAEEMFCQGFGLAVKLLAEGLSC